MHESLKLKRLASIAAISLAGVTALTGCSGGNHSQAKSECVAVGFSSAKGGSGLIGIDVYPLLRANDERPTKVFGKVVGGNDKGEPVTDSTAFAGAGEFSLSWDETSHAIQSATVEVAAVVAGNPKVIDCPKTTLHFDPKTNNIQPTYK